MWKYLSCLFGIVLIQYCTGYVLKDDIFNYGDENQQQDSQVTQRYNQNDDSSKSATNDDYDFRENEYKGNYLQNRKPSYYNQDLTLTYTYPWSSFSSIQPSNFLQTASSSKSTDSSSNARQKSSVSSSSQNPSSSSSSQNPSSSSSSQNPSSSSSSQNPSSSSSSQNPSSSSSSQNPSSSSSSQNPSSSSSSQNPSSSSSSQNPSSSSSSQNPSSSSSSQNPSSSSSSQNPSSSSSNRHSSSTILDLKPSSYFVKWPGTSPSSSFNGLNYNSNGAMPNAQQPFFDYMSNLKLKIFRSYWSQRKYMPRQKSFNILRLF